jgi:hypothetical protein
MQRETFVDYLRRRDRHRSDPVLMTHHDTGPMPPNALAQQTVDSVRRALERHVQASSSQPAPELRTALHALACEARERGVAPEQLLITLKGIWQSLPMIESAHDYGEQQRMLQRLVTICIKEYFAD